VQSALPLESEQPARVIVSPGPPRRCYRCRELEPVYLHLKRDVSRHGWRKCGRDPPWIMLRGHAATCSYGLT